MLLSVVSLISRSGPSLKSGRIPTIEECSNTDSLKMEKAGLGYVLNFVFYIIFSKISAKGWRKIFKLAAMGLFLTDSNHDTQMYLQPQRVSTFVFTSDSLTMTGQVYKKWQQIHTESKYVCSYDQGRNERKKKQRTTLILHLDIKYQTLCSGHQVIFTLSWHSPAMKHKKVCQIFSKERHWPSRDGKFDIYFFDCL